MAQIRALRHDIMLINMHYGTKGLIQLILTSASATFLPLELGESEKRSGCGGWYVANLQPFNRHESIALLNSALVADNNNGFVNKFINNPEIERATGWFGMLILNMFRFVSDLGQS